MIPGDTGPSPETPDEVAVLFSGGRDSSLTACLLLDTGARVHLLTFNDGSFTNFIFLTFASKKIQRIFPDNLVRRVTISSYGLFRKIALANIESDFATYQKNLIILGSQLASHAEAVLYCLKFDVRYIASGFTKYESFLPEQMPQAISKLKAFVEEYGIQYATPVYDYADADAVKYRLSRWAFQQNHWKHSPFFPTLPPPFIPNSKSVYRRQTSTVQRIYSLP